MNCTNKITLSLITRRTANIILCSYLRSLSTHNCCQSASQEVVITEERSSPSTVKKKLQKLPFAKNLFLGKFDHDILTYPEVLDKEQLQTLNEMVAPVENFFSAVDSKKIDQSGHITKEVLEQLKSLGLFGQQIPVDYGGLGLNATEYARLGEVTALDGSLAVTLAAHQSIGLKGLLIAGNEEQKRRYLPLLANGEWIAAFCLTEPGSGSDAASIQTRAVLSEDKKTWILNGNKIWISNGGLADFFTVFAKTELEDHKGEKYDSITAFIVERNFGGVSSGKPEDKLGIRGSNTTEVNFENTPVPVANVLGEVGEGFKVAMNILNSGRFSMGSSSAGVLKKLIGMTTEHLINRKQFGKSLAEFELVQEKLAKVTCLAYAMESMTYLTAGILDTYDNPDCSVEAAIVKEALSQVYVDAMSESGLYINNVDTLAFAEEFKVGDVNHKDAYIEEVYSSEGCWTAVSECLQLVGGLGYMKDYPFERYLRDSRIMMIFEGTNEILRMFIALVGIHHANNELQELVAKFRNPLLYPNIAIAKVLERRQHVNDNPKLKLGLDGYLHPSLQLASKLLEYCVLRLQYGVEIAVSHYGTKIVEKQMFLKRLADVVIDIYAMTAVLGRASRSYCIGLQDSEEEMLLATTICQEAHARVKKNIREIEQGSLKNMDENLKEIALHIYKNQGYFPQHPLARND